MSSSTHSNEVAHELVERVKSLPPLPAAALRLNELLTRSRTSAREVASLLSSDPAMAGRVLCVANSAQLGCGSRISTLSHAVMVLGFNSVRSIVLTGGLLRSLESGGDYRPGEQRRLWQHAITSGALARAIAVERGERQAEEHMLVGLLHDVGQIVVRGWLRAESERLDVLLRQGLPRGEAELLTLGTTHEEIGAELLTYWQLPKVFADVARFHHEPGLARECRTLAATVHVADILAHAVLQATTPDEEAPLLSHEAWQLLGVGEDRLPAILQAGLGFADRTAVLAGAAA